MGAGGAGLSHRTQQCVGAPSMACTSISWSLCNIQTHLCLTSQGKGLQEPSSLHCRDAHTPCTRTHTLCCSAPPWISRAVCWKAATPLHLVTWFPSKQTGVQSPGHCAGAGELSASPLGTKDAFSGTGISLPLKAVCGDVRSTRTQGHPQAFSFWRREGESSSRASLAQKPAPGLLQGTDLQKPSKEVPPPDPPLYPHGRGASHPPSPAAFAAEG